MQHHEQQVGGFLGAEGVRLAVTDKIVAHPTGHHAPQPRDEIDANSSSV